MTKSQQEHRQQVAEALRSNPSASNRQIAQAIGVDDKTVAAVRRGLIATGEVAETPRRVGVDGIARLARRLSDRISGGRPPQASPPPPESPSPPSPGAPTSGEESSPGLPPLPPPPPPRQAPGNGYPAECPRCGCTDLRPPPPPGAGADKWVNLTRKIQIWQCGYCGRRGSFRGS